MDNNTRVGRNRKSPKEHSIDASSKNCQFNGKNIQVNKETILSKDRSSHKGEEKNQGVVSCSFSTQLFDYKFVLHHLK